MRRSSYFAFFMVLLLLAGVSLFINIQLAKEFCELAGIEYSWKMLFLFWFLKGN